MLLWANMLVVVERDGVEGVGIKREFQRHDVWSREWADQIECEVMLDWVGSAIFLWFVERRFHFEQSFFTHAS